MDKIKISAMFPCYNDSGTIVGLIENITEELEKFSSEFEVIVVDDCSSDNSREVLKSAQKSNRRLKLIFHEQNMGYGATILDGLKNAEYPYFFYTDGDGQYDVKDISKLIKSMKSDTVLANGFKITRNDPYYRILIGKMYNLFMKFFFGIKLKDIDCDFRIIRRDIFENEKFFSQSGTICVEMVKKIEMRTDKIVESPVHHYERVFGTSQFFNFKRLLFVFFHVFELWNILILKRK